MKVLVGLIKNDLRRTNLINTRFFLVDEEQRSCDDVTFKIVNGVNQSGIANFKYKNGLAVYSFGCGLSHYLNNSNLKDIKTLNLSDCKLEMFTIKDVKNIFETKDVFDITLKDKVYRYIHEQEVFKRKQFLREERTANIEYFNRILNGEVEEYEKYKDDEVFIKDVQNRLKIEEKLLNDLEQ